ncbi:alkyl sulfatase C-terminal domain-containing protein [Streptomyces sp. BH104]|uniref:alkyl sulfatase C-terminal domain-containing protein n=1 Tax=Streptomyces sp. BH104 TaxID=3410407 RepID=UPI003BB74D2D
MRSPNTSNYSSAAQKIAADVTLTSTVPALAHLAVTGLTPAGLEQAGVQVEGDASVLGRLISVLDPGDRDFAIVTP